MNSQLHAVVFYPPISFRQSLFAAPPRSGPRRNNCSPDKYSDARRPWMPRSMAVFASLNTVCVFLYMSSVNPKTSAYLNSAPAAYSAKAWGAEQQYPGISRRNSIPSKPAAMIFQNHIPAQEIWNTACPHSRIQEVRYFYKVSSSNDTYMRG